MRACPWLVLLLSALTLSCNVEADFSDALEIETLNADAYQREIAAIDQLMFAESPLGVEKTNALVAQIESLAMSIKSVNDSKFLKLESLELRALAARLKRLPPSRTAEPFRNDWMRLRNNLFDDRAWFVRSPADLEYAASVVPPPPPQPIIPEPEPVPAAAPALPPFESRHTLSGWWRVVGLLANGNPTSDAEISNSRWHFESPRLTITDSKGETTVFLYEPAGEELRITSGPKVGPEGAWMRYRIDADGLLIAFHDDLAARPSSFEQTPGVSDPMLIVVRLRAER